MEGIIRVFGRAFLSVIFIIFGVASIFNWDIAYTDLDAALVNWQMYGGNIDLIGSCIDILVNYVSILLGAGLFLQIVGGLLVFLGFRPCLGATFLIIYLVCSTLLFYPFWFYQGSQMSLNLVLFLKNLSILGGVMLVFSSRYMSPRQYEMMDDDL